MKLLKIYLILQIYRVSKKYYKYNIIRIRRNAWLEKFLQRKMLLEIIPSLLEHPV